MNILKYLIQSALRFVLGIIMTFIGRCKVYLLLITKMEKGIIKILLCTFYMEEFYVYFYTN